MAALESQQLLHALANKTGRAVDLAYTALVHQLGLTQRFFGKGFGQLEVSMGWVAGRHYARAVALSAGGGGARRAGCRCCRQAAERARSLRRPPNRAAPAPPTHS